LENEELADWIKDNVKKMRRVADMLTTDFWGPASNFGIPIAAVMDTQKDPEMYVVHLFIYCKSVTALSGHTDEYNSISGPMTGTLALYSAVFARYALAVQPKNYLLFGCHVVNFSAQLTQGYRYLNYWKYVTTSLIGIHKPY
jgi:hypothetical protein